MRLSYALLLCLLLTACGRKEVNVEDLLDQVYIAHGVSNWDSIEQLGYVKESRVYNADNSTKLHTTQNHQYQMKPHFEAIIKWNSNEDAHQIVFSHGSAKKLINDKKVLSETVQKTSGESVNAALYTVSQPFKLRDPGVILTYESRDVLENGEEVHVVKASYDTDNVNHTKNDEWWYYFDAETYLCRATMVHHGSTYSYIKNLSYDQSTGVVFNAHRKGYAVDSTRKILYLQSEYFYTDYEVK